MTKSNRQVLIRNFPQNRIIISDNTLPSMENIGNKRLFSATLKVEQGKPRSCCYGCCFMLPLEVIRSYRYKNNQDVYIDPLDYLIAHFGDNYLCPIDDENSITEIRGKITGTQTRVIKGSDQYYLIISSTDDLINAPKISNSTIIIPFSKGDFNIDSTLNLRTVFLNARIIFQEIYYHDSPSEGYRIYTDNYSLEQLQSIADEVIAKVDEMGPKATIKPSKIEP